MLYLTIPFFVVKVYETKLNKNIQLESTVFVFTFFLRVKNSSKKDFYLYYICHAYYTGKKNQKINNIYINKLLIFIIKTNTFYKKCFLLFFNYM